jgi:AcrR family transcriptional regulator
VQQGYHGTSMRQIAKDTHMALGGLYNYFESKEVVFKEVLWEYHPYHDILPFLKDAQGDSFEEFMHNASKLMTNALEKHPDFLNLLFIEFVEFKGVHTAELFDTVFPLGFQIAQDVIERYTDQIRPYPPYILMRSILVLFFGYYLTWIVIARLSPPEFNTNAMEQLTDIYLHGIMEHKP